MCLHKHQAPKQVHETLVFASPGTPLPDCRSDTPCHWWPQAAHAKIMGMSSLDAMGRSCDLPSHGT